ncbi:MAG: hypothetical protein K9J13_14610 [Saprospiraceae bacterium]|nr:hypothetical protein [Saprospiraceae bacterium]
MEESLNYKSALLYLYWLMAGADGKKAFDAADPEWQTMRLMRKVEKISNKDFDNFINSDFGSQNEQLRKAISVIKMCNHNEKVRALAWMDKVMLADGDIHSKEYELYVKVRDEFGIEEDEIKNAKTKLPELK